MTVGGGGKHTVFIVSLYIELSDVLSKVLD